MTIADTHLAEPGSPATREWIAVCRIDDLTPDRGVAVLVRERAVALFHLAPTTTEPAAIHAVDHHDPATGAGVIARGLVGSDGPHAYVASPLHKDRYDLATGAGLDRPELSLAVWPVRVDGESVLVGATPHLP